MQRAYRTAQGVFAGIVLERLRAATDDADHLAEAMSFFNAWIFAWVEAIERRLTDVYMGEHEQWVRGAAAVRAAEVRALLGGAQVDAAAVSLRLGYELERFHVGFVVWSERPASGPGGGQLARRDGAGGGGGRRVAGRGPPLTVAEGRHLACWAGRQTPDLATCASPARRAGVSVAAGTPAPGSRASSSATARRSWRAASPSCAARRRAPVAYPDLALEALLADNPEAARRFAARELGPLAGGDDATVRLASTLAIFLEEGSSFVRAARRLGVHTNTVAYRVRRAESRSAAPSTSASSSCAWRCGWRGSAPATRPRGWRLALAY